MRHYLQNECQSGRAQRWRLVPTVQSVMMKTAPARSDELVTRGNGEFFRLGEGLKWARPGISTRMIYWFGGSNQPLNVAAICSMYSSQVGGFILVHPIKVVHDSPLISS